MLRFQRRPDKVFEEILNNALGAAIDGIDIDLDNMDEGEELDSHYFEEEILKAFGGGRSSGELLKRELQKLQKAHLSEKLYMPTDRHFQLLHRIISVYCEEYNDMVGCYDSEEDAESSVHKDSKGRAIDELDIDMIGDYFFWDLDFDLPIKAALLMKNSADKTIQKMGDFSNVAINASCNAPVDGEDLLLKEVESDWGMLEDEFPWIEDELDSTEFS
jgi:hypothetical protein